MDVNYLCGESVLYMASVYNSHSILLPIIYSDLQIDSTSSWAGSVLEWLISVFLLYGHLKVLKCFCKVSQELMHGSHLNFQRK